MVPFISLAKSIESDDDRRFMTELYQRYLPLIRWTVFKYSQRQDLEDDLVQDSAVRLIRNMEKLREIPEKARVNYIFYTARSAALNAVEKTNRREKHQAEPDVLQHLTAPDPGPETLLERSEARLTAEIVLSRLPELDRILLQCRYYLQLKDREIAELTNLKTEYVRVYVQRAREKARNLLRSVTAAASQEVHHKPHTD